MTDHHSHPLCSLLRRCRCQSSHLDAVPDGALIDDTALLL